MEECKIDKTYLIRVKDYMSNEMEVVPLITVETGIWSLVTWSM